VGPPLIVGPRYHRSWGGGWRHDGYKRGGGWRHR